METWQKSQQAKTLTSHKVLHDNVLIAPVDFSNDGVVYNPKSYEDKPEFGVILQVGTGCSDLLHEGDFILFERYSAMKTNIENQDFIFIKEENVLSTLSEAQK